MTRATLGNLRASAAPGAVLVLAIPLLQHHSIEFLTAWKTDAPAGWDAAMLLAPWSGWGWSLALEVVALWMWYERGAARRALAVLATAALLFGPIYLTVSKEAREWRAIKSESVLAEREAPLIAADVAEKKATLAAYRRNSETRFGWQSQIADAERELAGLRAEQKANTARIIAAAGWAWGPIAKAAGWIAIILLCRLANVAAITSLSRRFRAAGVSISPPPSGEYDAFTLKSIRDRTLVYLQRSDLSQREFCERHGVSAPDLSCFLAMFDKDRTAGRKPARKAIQRLEAVLREHEATP